MWIALFVFGALAWLGRNKRKNPETKSKTVIVVLILFGFLAIHSVPKQEYTISGKLRSYKKGGTFYVYLVDQDQFKIPLSGLDTIKVSAESGTAEYCFRGIPKGRYALRCFQDVNGNGVLDKGMFGPAEPYAFSGKQKSFPVRFEELAFELDQNKTIQLKFK